MFDFLRSYKAEIRELSTYLTVKWKMKPAYVNAFLDTYKKEVGSALVLCKKRMSAAHKSKDPDQSLAAKSILGQEYAMALVTAAYSGFRKDLKKGKHVGTEVERSIWAILSSRSDIVNQMDPAFGKYIADNFEEKFPGLFAEVFEG